MLNTAAPRSMFGQEGGSGPSSGGVGSRGFQRSPMTLRPSGNDGPLPWDSSSAPQRAGARAPNQRPPSAVFGGVAAARRTAAPKKAAKIMSPEQMHNFIRQQRGGREHTSATLPPEFRSNTVPIAGSSRRAEIPPGLAQFAREFKPKGNAQAAAPSAAKTASPSATKRPPAFTSAFAAPATLPLPAKGYQNTMFGGAPQPPKSVSNSETLNSIMRQYGRPMQPRAAAPPNDEKQAALAERRAKMRERMLAQQTAASTSDGEAVKKPVATTVATDDLIRQMQRQQRRHKVQRPKTGTEPATDANEEGIAAPTPIDEGSEVIDNDGNEEKDESDDKWAVLQNAQQPNETEDAPFFADEARNAIETATQTNRRLQNDGAEEFTGFNVSEQRQ